ncbi:MAG: amino acid permease, partial [Acidobacteria bacterium]|nr:amino acid permease [Acidobacteriota bacterium]
MEQAGYARDRGLVRGLGLVDATTLVMGSMIGSGVFIVAADIARQVNSAGLLLATWVVAGTLTMIAALSYGELAAAMPHAGGQYVYLREAFGPLSGFLYGWTLFLVIQTGTIAAVAVAFAKFTGVFLPWVSESRRIVPAGPTTQQLTAIAVVVLLTLVNARGIRTGAMIQNVFTFAKVASLLCLAGFGLALGRNPQAVERNFSDFWGAAGWLESGRLVGVAMVGA